MFTEIAALSFLSVLVLAYGTTHVTQIHIAVAGSDETGNPTGMRVMWYSADVPGDPYVAYGSTPDNLDKTSNVTSQQYMEGYGYHHMSLIEGLAGFSTTYYYQVCNDANTCSEVLSFKTAPPVDSTIRLSVYGDLGYEDSSMRPMEIHVGGLVKDWSATYTRQQLEKLHNGNEIDMVWHLGDIGYADDSFGHKDTLVHFGYEKVYNGFMNWMENISSQIPYMVSPGNHESECHSPTCLLSTHGYAKPLSNFSAYNVRWKMPSEESGGRGNSAMWYSWNYGPVHFVSLDTETDFPGAGEEKTGDSGDKNLPAGSFGRDGEYLAWLESDLKRADAARKADPSNKRQWIIAGGHRPYGEIEECCGALFEKYGVDLYFAGHSHSYSRSLPASSKGVETHHDLASYQSPTSTAWVVVGGPGCDEMEQGSKDTLDSVKLQQDGYLAPLGSLVVSSARYASGVLVANSSVLSWKLIDSEDSSIIDSFTISK